MTTFVSDAMNTLVRTVQSHARQVWDKLTANAMIASAFADIQTRWQSLSRDGQRFIQWSAVLLVLTLVWAFLWLPATRQREALVTRIPVLQNQLATMRIQADEIKRIQAMPPVLTTNARALADTVGLQVVFGTNAKVTINESRQFLVTVNNVAYINWLNHLDAALNRYRVRVVSVSLQPLAQNGTDSNNGTNNASNNTPVNVTLVLADDSAGR